MNFSIFRSFLTFFNNVTFLFMIDGKSKNRFALNNVYMIVLHLPAIYLFTCAIAHIMLINYLTMRISPHIVLLFVTRLNITFFFEMVLTPFFYCFRYSVKSNLPLITSLLLLISCFYVNM